jgi:hypothetical protein
VDVNVVYLQTAWPLCTFMQGAESSLGLTVTSRLGQKGLREGLAMSLCIAGLNVSDASRNCTLSWLQNYAPVSPFTGRESETVKRMYGGV